MKNLREIKLLLWAILLYQAVRDEMPALEFGGILLIAALLQIFLELPQTLPKILSRVFFSWRARMTPNDQELSHAAGDFRPPENRSENCQA